MEVSNEIKEVIAKKKGLYDLMIKLAIEQGKDKTESDLYNYFLGAHWALENLEMTLEE